MKRAALALLIAACADQAAPAPEEPAATAVAHEPAPAAAYDGWSFAAIVTHAVVSHGERLSPTGLGDEVAVYLVTRYGALSGPEQIVDVSLVLDGATGADLRHELGRHEVYEAKRPFGAIEVIDGIATIDRVTYEIVTHGRTLAVWIDGRHEVTVHLDGASTVTRPTPPVGGKRLAHPHDLEIKERDESWQKAVRDYVITLRVGDVEGPLGNHPVAPDDDTGWRLDPTQRRATRSFQHRELDVEVLHGDVVVTIDGDHEIARVGLPEQAWPPLTVPRQPSPPRPLVVKKLKVTDVVQPVKPARIEKTYDDYEVNPEGVEDGLGGDVGGVVGGVPMEPPPGSP